MTSSSTRRAWRARACVAALATLSAGAWAADSGNVCVYEDINYGGAHTCVDTDTAWIGSSWNDKASSVRLRAGYQATLYDDINYGGRSLALTGDTANLVTPNFNDITSSLRVTQACVATDWSATAAYALGAVVRYLPDGHYYKVVNVTSGGTDFTNPTISTWYWSPTTCGGAASPGNGKVVGVYYPNWTPSPPRIRNLDANYNLVYLFAATPVGGAPGTTGAVTFTPPGDGLGAATNLVADIQYARKTQGRKIMLSVGGAGNGMSFPNRGKSQAFLDSVVAIYNQLGGIDGLDWNTFEGSQAPDTSEMIWISLQLKQRFPGFIISAPPAPWNSVDKVFCQAMVNAGAMDYAAPQYYDGPGLADPAYVVPNVAEWVALLGASHVVIGFGINPSAANYMTPAAAITIWNQVRAASPTIHGGFDWEISTDVAQGFPFAHGVGNLIKQ
jgi:chitinase